MKMLKIVMRIVSKNFIITILLLSNALFLCAQNESGSVLERGRYLSLNVLGTASLVGVTYDKIINEHFVWEVGLGVAGVGTGLSYYPKKMKLNKICPYVGIKLNTIALVDVGSGYGGYVPIGITFFETSKFNFGIDIGPGYARTDLLFDNHSKNIKENYFILFGNIKMGVSL